MECVTTTTHQDENGNIWVEPLTTQLCQERDPNRGHVLCFAGDLCIPWNAAILVSINKGYGLDHKIIDVKMSFENVSFVDYACQICIIYLLQFKGGSSSGVVVKLLACGVRGPGLISSLVATTSEICYLLLLSRDMAEA